MVLNVGIILQILLNDRTTALTSIHANSQMCCKCGGKGFSFKQPIFHRLTSSKRIVLNILSLLPYSFRLQCNHFVDICMVVIVCSLRNSHKSRKLTVFWGIYADNAIGPFFIAYQNLTGRGCQLFTFSRQAIYFANNNNNLCDLVYQTPTRTYQSLTAVVWSLSSGIPSRF